MVITPPPLSPSAPGRFPGSASPSHERAGTGSSPAWHPRALARPPAYLSRPGALVAGLNWYRANIDPAAFVARSRGVAGDRPVHGRGATAGDAPGPIEPLGLVPDDVERLDARGDRRRRRARREQVRPAAVLEPLDQLVRSGDVPTQHADRLRERTDLHVDLGLTTVSRAGVTIAITTDHPVVPINFLVHQASLAVKDGLDRETALRALTINPARIAGVHDRIDSIEAGKDADLVIWSGDPLDVLSRAERAFIDGAEIYSYEGGEHVFASL